MPGHSYKGGGSKFTPTTPPPATPVLSQSGLDIVLTGGAPIVVWYLTYRFDSGADWGVIDSKAGPSPLVFSGDASPGQFYASQNGGAVGPGPGDSNVLII